MTGPGANNGCQSSGLCPSNIQCGVVTVCAGSSLVYTLGTLPGPPPGSCVQPGTLSYGISGGTSSTVSGSNYTLTFATPGTYQVQAFLNWQDCGCFCDEPPFALCCHCYSTGYVTVTVLPNPLNPVLNVYTPPLCAGQPVCFIFGNQPNPGTYTFTTGTGVTYSNVTPSPNPTFCSPGICYSTPNTYYPTLTYGDANGCKATTTTPLVVNPIQANPSYVQNCDVFNFSANPGTCAPLGSTYLWAFGDGGTSTAQNPQHVYASVGPFNVTLTITSGCASAIFNLSVNSNQNCCTIPIIAGRIPVSIAAGTTLTLGAGRGGTLNINNTDYTAYAGSTIKIISPTVFNASTAVNFNYCTFLMYPGSKIVLYTNNTNTVTIPACTQTSVLTVTFDHCHLYGCSQLWEGIRFAPNPIPPGPSCGSEGFTALTFATNLNINYTLLEDAYKGVDNSNAFVPKITFTNSMFNKNRIDFLLDQWRLASGSFSKNTAYTCRQVTYSPSSGTQLPIFSNAVNYYNTKLNPVAVASVKPSLLNGLPTSTPRGDIGGKLLYNVPTSVGGPQKFNLSANQNIYDRHNQGVTSDMIDLVIGKQYFYNLNVGVLSNGYQSGNGGAPRLDIGNSAASSNSFKDCVTGIFTRFKTLYLTASSNVFTGTGGFNFDYGIRVNDFGTAGGGNNCIITNNQIKNVRLNAIWFNLNDSINALVQGNSINYTSSIYKNFFSKGILVNENGNPSTALYNIDGNGIYFTYTGIECLNTAGTLITNNNIQINTRSVQLCSTCYNYGINNINCSTNSIGDNTITGDNVQAHNWQFGINSVNHPGQNIYCNIIKGTSTGINLQGPSMTAVNLPIRNNDLTDELIDVWMLNACVVGPQGNSNSPIDNTFNHSTTTYTNSFCSAQTQGSSSPFYIKMVGLFNMTKNYWDLIPFGSAMSPQPASGSSPQSCNTGGGIHRMINLARQIALDSVFAASDLRNTFVSHRHLYNNLISVNINTSGDAVLTNFKNVHAAGNIGKLFTIDKNISDGLANNNPVLITQAAQMNNNLVPANSFEVLHKQVNSAYLNYLNNGFMFNAADLSSLRQIAVLCPFTDGAAVWQARSLLMGIDSIPYFSPCEIIPLPVISGQRLVNSETSESINQNAETSIFPNPNTGSFTVAFTGKAKNISVEIYNVFRQLVLNKAFEIENTTEVKIDNLNPGVYLVKLLIDGIHNKTDRIIVT